MSEFTHTDIRKFITSILTTGKVLKVDDEGIIHWNDETEEIVTVNIEGGKGVLHTYTVNAKHPDAVIVCPISEGLTLTTDRKWFYKITTNILQQQLIKIINLLLNFSISLNTEEIAPTIFPYIKNLANKVDDKVIEEFLYIVKTHPKDILSLMYNPKAKETKLFTGLEDVSGEFQKSIPTSKVRKKSWNIFQALIRNIFQTTAPVSEEYVATTCLMTCPQFRTYMELWIKCWRSFSPILNAIEMEDTELDIILDDIENVHMERIDVYYKMCQWFTQMAAKPSKEVKSKVAITSKVQDISLTPNPEGVETPILHKKSKWDTSAGGVLIGDSASLQKIAIPQMKSDVPQIGVGIVSIGSAPTIGVPQSNVIIGTPQIGVPSNTGIGIGQSNINIPLQRKPSKYDTQSNVGFGSSVPTYGIAPIRDDQSNANPLMPTPNGLIY